MAEHPKKRHRSSTSAPCLCTLRIELHPDEIQPAIWRRMVVDGRVSLAKLHHFIQAAFGWTDAHLHEFTIRDIRYAPSHPHDLVDDIEIRDERKAYLNRLLDVGDQFVYLYDFGDSWNHPITVEKIESVEGDPHGHAWLEGGARACPPEDVGGAHGYQAFLETVLGKPHSEEAKELLIWAGGTFNAELFDHRAANAAIQRILWNAWGGK
ncbi:MAG: plasmid pRiA4b ORF-3 family protein [Sulfurimicrobium sp.]|nr:plasmid pRiA4b ORF-3 family protein [Sulfurimicrobium sp.]